MFRLIVVVIAVVHWVTVATSPTVVPTTLALGPGVVTASSSQVVQRTYNRVVPLENGSAPEPPKISIYRRIDNSRKPSSTTLAPTIATPTVTQSIQFVGSAPQPFQYVPYYSFLYCYRVPVQLQYLPAN